MTRVARKNIGFAQVFAVREFRALWVAQVLSLVGDQLARVALSVLVYNRTGSALLTGLVYGLGFLPAVVGGPLLGGLADRLPRRGLMITCDLLRAALVVLMAFSTDRLILLVVLLVLAELLSAPFSAARAALLADVLSGERYLLATAVGNITDQAAQVLGFALGGALVALLGTRQALLLDAATFGAAAALLGGWVAARAAAARPRAVGLLGPALEATRWIGSQPELLILVRLALICAFYVVPEGLAAPYAVTLGGGAALTGLLMAAQPAGAALGAVLVARLLSPRQRRVLLTPMAALSCASLIGCATRPGAVTTLLLLALSGLGVSYQLTANAAFVTRIPAQRRGQVFGVVQSAIVGVQGVALVVAGAAADHLSPPVVVAAAGVTGTAAVLTLAVRSKAALAILRTG